MRVAINGFGRIGKLVLRSFIERKIKGIETTKRDIRSEKINNISKNQQQLAVQKKQY